jgi:hypothetical protein
MVRLAGKLDEQLFGPNHTAVWIAKPIEFSRRTNGHGRRADISLPNRSLAVNAGSRRFRL